MYYKKINQNFFKKCTSSVAYVLGYFVADGCIVVKKDRKNNPYVFNITSANKEHLEKIRQVMNSGHAISAKSRGSSTRKSYYQLQISNQVICKNLMKLGILPRKTYNLDFIKIPNNYFSDFVRGFFDGDGSVYIYTVNGTPQIKASFSSASYNFINELNKKICKNLNIPTKTIHKENQEGKLTKYVINFYIDDCEKLARFMYKNNPSLYLLRKYKIFKKWDSISRRKYRKTNYPSKIGWQLNQKVFISK